MTAAGRAREEAFEEWRKVEADTVGKCIDGYDLNLEPCERCAWRNGYTRAIAAAVEVAEGHRCLTRTDLPFSPFTEMQVTSFKPLHPNQDCAEAIAAELKRLM